jgi:hypothetical protein
VNQRKAPGRIINHKPPYFRHCLSYCTNIYGSAQKRGLDRLFGRLVEHLMAYLIQLYSNTASCTDFGKAR